MEEQLQQLKQMDSEADSLPSFHPPIICDDRENDRDEPDSIQIQDTTEIPLPQDLFNDAEPATEFIENPSGKQNPITEIKELTQSSNLYVSSCENELTDKSLINIKINSNIEDDIQVKTIVADLENDKSMHRSDVSRHNPDISLSDSLLTLTPISKVTQDASAKQDYNDNDIHEKWNSINLDTSESLNKQWKNDFNEDSLTFNVFRISSDLPDGTTKCDKVDNNNIKPTLLDDTPDDGTSGNTTDRVDNIQGKFSIKSTSDALESKSIKQTDTFHFISDLLEPIACSCSSYNVFSVVRKMTVLVLVSMALIYSVLVAPAVESGNISEQSIIYQLKDRGEKHIGLYEPNELFGTGQEYPPPRRFPPSVSPIMKRRRRKKRRKVKYDVQKVLPDIIKEHLEALEHGDNVKVMPDEVIKHHNARLKKTYIDFNQMNQGMLDKQVRLKEHMKL